MKILFSNILFFLFFYSIDGHVILNYPVGNEIFIAGEEITLEWVVAVYHGPASFELLYSDNGGDSWEIIVSGISESITSHNWIVPNMVTTTGRIKVIQVNTGVNYDYNSSDFSITTPTTIGESEIVEYSFNLNNPYPNPFNNRSVISFELTSSGNVQLLIYDLLGRKVETLINEVRSEGKYNFSWNASTLSSGTYILILKSESYIKSKKLILMK